MKPSSFTSLRKKTVCNFLPRFCPTCCPNLKFPCYEGYYPFIRPLLGSDNAIVCINVWIFDLEFLADYGQACAEQPTNSLYIDIYMEPCDQPVKTLSPGHWTQS